LVPEVKIVGHAGSVPTFRRYFPSRRDLRGPGQRAFFADLESHLGRGEFLDVEGNVSYVFLFLYGLVRAWRKDLGGLSDHLIRIGELYAHEGKVADYCHFWAYDCLLAQSRFDEYLEKTEPTSPVGTSTHAANIRLNVQRWVGREAEPVDVLLTSGSNRSSHLIKTNEGLYREHAEAVLTEFAAPHGGWFALFDRWGSGVEKYGHHLFGGSLSSTLYERRIACFYSARELAVIRELALRAENQTRAALGVPGVGEGWVSETDLFRQIQAAFPETSVVQHGRPAWLGRQHFDVWLPHWRIALEYQGLQHFEPVDFFGGREAFERTVERDQRKAEVTQREGVHLLLVTEEDDIGHVIARVRALRENEVKALYAVAGGDRSPADTPGPRSGAHPHRT
jgi:hypothetical protein